MTLLGPDWGARVGERSIRLVPATIRGSRRPTNATEDRRMRTQAASRFGRCDTNPVAISLSMKDGAGEHRTCASVGTHAHASKQKPIAVDTSGIVTNHHSRATNVADNGAAGAMSALPAGAVPVVKFGFGDRDRS